MAFFPLRHTIECDLPPDHVMERLDHFTDSRKRSTWQRFWSVGTYLKKNSGSRRFEGQVDLLERSFCLRTNLYSSDMMQTAFSGRVELDGSGSKLRVWISATKAGSWGVALFFAALFYGSFPHSFQSVRPSPALPALIIPLLLIAVAIDFLYVHNLAKRLFLETITGEADEGDDGSLRLPHPIHSSSAKAKYLTPADSLVDHFLLLSDHLFGSEAIPPHSLDISQDKKSLTLTFPAQAEDGYEVKVIMKDEQATVWAGEWIQIPFDDPSPEDTVNQVIAALHDLLSPQCRLRENYVSGVLVFAGLDSLRSGEWEEGVCSHVPSVVAAPGEIEEMVYTNRQMPITQGRLFL